MTALEAKFARESKDTPRDWIIAPAGQGLFKLVRITGERS